MRAVGMYYFPFNDSSVNLEQIIEVQVPLLGKSSEELEEH
jgi:hypothetical protein